MAKKKENYLESEWSKEGNRLQAKLDQREKDLDETIALAKANQKALEELKDQFEKAFKALDNQHKLLVERNRLR